MRSLCHSATAATTALIVFFGLTSSVRAQDPTVGDEFDGPTPALYRSESWPGGTTTFGTLGGNRIDAAVPLPSGDWLVNLSGTYFITDDFFGDGGENRRTQQTINFLWSPIELLEISAGWSIVSNRNDASEIPTTVGWGDPSFRLKASHLVSETFGVGALVGFRVPTSAGGTGLDPSAFILDTSLLSSARLLSILQVSANVGYRLDNSRELFQRPDDALTPAQRFGAGVAELDQVTWGVGAELEVDLGDAWHLDPFAEFVGGIPLSGASTTESPLLASLGAKLMPFGKLGTEFVLGGDVRLSGAPDAEANELPGLPPWELFARVGIHLNPPKPPPIQQAAPAPRSSQCDSEADCSEGSVCDAGSCVRIKTETQIVETAPDMFRIMGSVLNQAGEPLGRARVRVSDHPETLLAVDYKSGQFRSMPLAVGEGLVELSAEAPGYRTATQQLQRGSKDAQLTATFKLKSLGQDAVGEIKGSLKDARSGRSIKGQIFIPALNRKIRVDTSGVFSARVKANRYQILISSRGYITQKKDIEIRAGDTVILNVDLSRRR
ncbi:MAG: carboxypeptidase-like regulatory domain-containing protein [Myxococcota bacterium]